MHHMGIKSITCLHLFLVLELEIICSKIPGLHTILPGLLSFPEAFDLHYTFDQEGMPLFLIVNIYLEL